jgi:hypothetical protein
MSTRRCETRADMKQPMPFCNACGDPRILASGYSPNPQGFSPWTIYGCGHVTTGEPEHIEAIEASATDDVSVTVEVPDASPDLSFPRAV